MANRRLELQNVLKDILGTDEVYFQPPPNVRMGYPAIRYRLSDIYDLRADNRIYRDMDMYEVIYITRDPDDENVRGLMHLPLSRFVRSYISNNLYHYVYYIYH